MEDQPKKDHLQQLEKENLQLKLELKYYRSKKSIGNSFRKILGRSSSNYLVGKGLKKSVLRLYKEIPEGKVTKDSLADFTSYLLMRITRIGLFTLLIAVVPLFILSVQTYMLNKQNTLLQYQNERLDQQINLEEGSRRSSLIFLMSNIMDKIGEELKESGNDGELSESLISRIISLSQALRPYRYLENDKLIERPLSPERGQLLTSLVNSHLKEKVYAEIFLRANFSYADLQGANLNDAYLEEVNLQYANLKDANLTGADLDYANLSNTNLTNATLDQAYLKNVRLNNANLENASLDNVKMQEGQLTNAILSRAKVSGDFTNTNLNGVLIHELTIGFVELDGAEINNVNILTEMDRFKVIGKTYIEENFKVVKEQILDTAQVITDSISVFRRKTPSTLTLIDDCQKQVLEIIKSTKRLKELERDAIKKKDPLEFLIVAHPFGEESLDIYKDSVYRYILTTEQQSSIRPISYLLFNPEDSFVIEMTSTDTFKHRINTSLMRGFPENCRIQ